MLKQRREAAFHRRVGSVLPKRRVVIEQNSVHDGAYEIRDHSIAWRFHVSRMARDPGIAN